jgi:hypothetical protein
LRGIRINPAKLFSSLLRLIYSQMKPGVRRTEWVNKTPAAQAAAQNCLPMKLFLRTLFQTILTPEPIHLPVFGLCPETRRITFAVKTHKK